MHQLKYITFEEATVEKYCKYCNQKMDIRQITLTEAVRQCFKCSTPFYHMSPDDIEFIHRSYNDIDREPAKWKVCSTTHEEELGIIQNASFTMQQKIKMYIGSDDDSSDDDDIEQILEGSKETNVPKASECADTPWVNFERILDDACSKGTPPHADFIGLQGQSEPTSIETYSEFDAIVQELDAMLAGSTAKLEIEPSHSDLDVVQTLQGSDLEKILQEGCESLCWDKSIPELTGDTSPTPHNPGGETCLFSVDSNINEDPQDCEVSLSIDSDVHHHKYPSRTYPVNGNRSIFRILCLESLKISDKCLENHRSTPDRYQLAPPTQEQVASFQIESPLKNIWNQKVNVLPKLNLDNFIKTSFQNRKTNATEPPKAQVVLGRFISESCTPAAGSNTPVNQYNQCVTLTEQADFHSSTVTAQNFDSSASILPGLSAAVPCRNKPSAPPRRIGPLESNSNGVALNDDTELKNFAGAKFKPTARLKSVGKGEQPLDPMMFMREIRDPALTDEVEFVSPKKKKQKKKTTKCIKGVKMLERNKKVTAREQKERMKLRNEIINPDVLVTTQDITDTYDIVFQSTLDQCVSLEHETGSTTDGSLLTQHVLVSAENCSTSDYSLLTKDWYESTGNISIPTQPLSVISQHSLISVPVDQCVLLDHEIGSTTDGSLPTQHVLVSTENCSASNCSSPAKDWYESTGNSSTPAQALSVVSQHSLISVQDEPVTNKDLIMLTQDAVTLYCDKLVTTNEGSVLISL